MKTYYALISILASTLFLSGMSTPLDHASSDGNNIDTQQATVHKHSDKTATGYTKPHAGIDLRYAQPGLVQPGETLTLELSLSSRMAGDLMQVRITHDNGLHMNSATEHEFSTSQGMMHTLPVSVTALQQGRLHIDVLVSVRVDGKFQSRAFSILLNVGDPASYKSANDSKPLPEGYKLDRERGVISMPAVESGD
jgi:hypothetical protein